MNNRTRTRRPRDTLLALPLICWLLGGLAIAQEQDQAAKEAAKAVGAVGQAAARAVASDASQPLNVPGFAGTDRPEANHTAAGMETAARRALADPNDAGGAVGRAVVDGTLSRPDVSLSETDPEIQRGDTVQNTPNAPTWRADSLASGTVRECGADLDDAGAGGRCGGVTYCVGAGCERVDTPANTAFVPAAAQLNMVMEMGGDEFDRGNMSIFTGEHRACPVRFLGGQNCCTDSGVFLEVGLASCTVEEEELAEARAAGVTHYLGEYCAKRILGICRRRDRAWCVFTSELGRILHEQARPQLGMTWDDCRGFSIAEIQRIDFDRVDLSEFTDTLLDANEAPGISLPNAGATGAAMRNRIGEFYREND